MKFDAKDNHAILRKVIFHKLVAVYSTDGFPHSHYLTDGDSQWEKGPLRIPT